MEHISPELALVDPELRARACLELAVPGDCLAPRRPVRVEVDVVQLCWELGLRNAALALPSRSLPAHSMSSGGLPIRVAVVGTLLAAPFIGPVLVELVGSVT